jgi:hypothetical protein
VRNSDLPFAAAFTDAKPPAPHTDRYTVEFMADIWPQSVLQQVVQDHDETLRPFHCVILMPFDSQRFEDVAAELKRVVETFTRSFLETVEIGPTVVERLDWVTSAGAIQHQLWERLARADLIFCDLTGQNPNVMFEAGVCAAWKRPEQVIFLRDAFYRPDQPFDIHPFRYLKYRMTSDGILQFEDSLQKMIAEVVVGFPDRHPVGEPTRLGSSLEMDFSDNRDNPRLLTAPLSHRGVRDGMIQFGSLWSFPHSWATIGKERFSHFTLKFTARFAKLHPAKDRGYIGVGFRSHHYYVPFQHVLYLNRDGSVVLAQPDDAEERGYRDTILREPTPIDVTGDHTFELALQPTGLTVRVDNFGTTLSEMPKLLTPGLIRFQAYMCWIGIRQIRLTVSS